MCEMALMSAAPAHVAGSREAIEAAAHGATQLRPRTVHRFWYLGVALACAMGAVFVLGATARGIGLSPDSMQYLAASESAVRGDGLVTIAWEGEPTPLTHFPPAYPLLLAAAARGGWSVTEFARWFNVALFALTIVLASVITRRVAPESSWAVPLAALTFAMAHDLVVAHSMAWTEPLYLTLTLAGVLALGSAIKQRSLAWLAIAAAVAGLAALVRYVGVANVGLVALAALFWWPAPLRQRVRAASIGAIIAASPLLTVLAISSGSGDAPVANRQLLWHPLGATDLWMGAAVVGKWVSPLSDANYITAAWLAALLGLVAFVVAARARAQTSLAEPRLAERPLVRMLALYAAMYLTVLVATMTFADAQTLFDPRLLVPMLAVAIIIGVVWLSRSSALGSRVRLATWSILALVVLAELSRLLPWMLAANVHGLALRRLDPSDRAVVAATQGLTQSARIYSNRPYFLRAQTKRAVAGIPRERDPNTLLPNARLVQQVRAICDSAASKPTYLVLFAKEETEDPTVTVVPASRSGDAARQRGGDVVRVRPGCGAPAADLQSDHVP